MKTLLFTLISFVALTSSLSGIMMMCIPDGSVLNLPVGLLKGTPFRDYFLPGLLLTIFVGGINFTAVYFNILRHPARYNWAIAGGLVLCIWMIAQISVIRGALWFDFVLIAAGVMIFLIAYQLKGKMLV